MPAELKFNVLYHDTIGCRNPFKSKASIFFYIENYKLEFIKSLGVSRKNNTSLHINLAGSSFCTEPNIYCFRTLRFHLFLLQGLYTLVNLRFVNVCEHFVI